MLVLLVISIPSFWRTKMTWLRDIHGWLRRCQTKGEKSMSSLLLSRSRFLSQMKTSENVSWLFMRCWVFACMSPFKCEELLLKITPRALSSNALKPEAKYYHKFCFVQTHQCFGMFSDWNMNSIWSLRREGYVTQKKIFLKNNLGWFQKNKFGKLL